MNTCREPGFTMLADRPPKPEELCGVILRRKRASPYAEFDLSSDMLDNGTKNIQKWPSTISGIAGVRPGALRVRLHFVQFFVSMTWGPGFRATEADLGSQVFHYKRRFVGV